MATATRRAKNNSKAKSAQVVLTQVELKKRILETMEDELRLTGRQANDFIESTCAVVEQALSQGEAVKLFNLVKIAPRLSPAKPKRPGRNPATGEEIMLAAKPAAVTIKARPLKRLKDAAPSLNSNAGKALKN